MAEKVGGKVNAKTPAHAYRYGFHSYPDVMTGLSSGSFPTEIHEVAEIKMTAIKLKEYQNASCKNILWILTKAPLLKSFDVVRNLYTDQDNYLNDNLLTGRGRRD